jgi:hypothetical protein
MERPIRGVEGFLVTEAALRAVVELDVRYVDRDPCCTGLEAEVHVISMETREVSCIETKALDPFATEDQEQSVHSVRRPLASIEDDRPPGLIDASDAFTRPPGE